jgi:hypothetical protein
MCYITLNISRHSLVNYIPCECHIIIVIDVRSLYMYSSKRLYEAQLVLFLRLYSLLFNPIDTIIKKYIIS